MWAYRCCTWFVTVAHVCFWVCGLQDTYRMRYGAPMCFSMICVGFITLYFWTWFHARIRKVAEHVRTHDNITSHKRLHGLGRLSNASIAACRWKPPFFIPQGLLSWIWPTPLWYNVFCCCCWVSYPILFVDHMMSRWQLRVSLTTKCLPTMLWGSCWAHSMLMF